MLLDLLRTNTIKVDSADVERAMQQSRMHSML